MNFSEFYETINRQFISAKLLASHKVDCHLHWVLFQAKRQAEWGNFFRYFFLLLFALPSSLPNRACDTLSWFHTHSYEHTAFFSYTFFEDQTPDTQVHTSVMCRESQKLVTSNSCSNSVMCLWLPAYPDQYCWALPLRKQQGACFPFWSLFPHRCWVLLSSLAFLIYLSGYMIACVGNH